MALKTIIIKGRDKAIRKEGKAIAAITPGELIEIAPTGVQRHSTAVGNAARTFAVENELFGKDIDTDYAIADQVLYGAMPPGSEVYALLEASSAAVIIGDFLTSAGDGSLRKQAAAAATPDTAREAVVAQAIEAVTPGGSKTRCMIQML